MKRLMIFFVSASFLFPVSCYLGDATDSEGTNIYVPEINLRGGELGITSGGSYDYGKVQTLASKSVKFVIENLGRDYLTLQGDPYVQVSGTDASMFVVTVQPSTPIGPYSYRSFTVVFTPATDGVKTATVTIQNSDDDEGTFSFTVTGEGDPNLVPEINIVGYLSGSGSYDFGNVAVGSSSADIPFTLQNLGTAVLTLSGAPIVNITGADAAMFSVITMATSPVAASGSTTFEIRFTPASSGVKNATVSIANDDSDENPYTFTITGTGTVVPAPEIHVTQSGTYLPDGTGVFDFGNINQGSSSANIQFTVTNLGNADLHINNMTNSNNTDFVPAFPGGYPITVASLATQTFTVQFTPTSAGVLSSTITITNDDADENPYTFTVQGTGVAVPEMDVVQAGAVADGGSRSFGSIQEGTSTALTFTINNTGSGALTLPGTPIVAITGDSEFSLTASPGVSIAGGGNDTFEITFSPLVAGTYSAIVTIANNDANENPYDINISGTATVLPEPEIVVRQGLSDIPSGGSTPYDFGGMTVGGTPVDITFTIENIGSANLVLSSSPRVVLSGSGNFSLVTDATTPVASSGGTTTFTVRFTASGETTDTATVTIANDDANEGTYQFDITATGTRPEMNLKQGAANIASGGSHNYGDVNVGASKLIDFTIENTSASSVLLLTGSPKVAIVGSADFSIVSQPSASSVGPSGTSQFSIRYTPSGTGNVSATVSIGNNDGNGDGLVENPYTFTVNGNGVNPNINIPEVASGGTIGFGSVKYNTSPILTFNIQNTGTSGDLILKSTPFVLVSGADASFFSVTTQPALGTIAPSGSQPFIITFNPTNSTATGLKTATVSIYSNDNDTPVYSFTITGTVTVPVISITGTPSGGTYTFANVNYTDAGTAVAFTINNSGAASLSLTGAPNVQISGAGSGHFTVTQPLSSTIAGGGGSTTFTIQFTPTALGTHTATITIPSDDPNTPSYSFTIEGTCDDTELPLVTVANPSGNPSWNGTKTLQATASDNVGVVSVSYYIDSVSAPNFIGSSSTAATYDVSIVTTSYSEGAHTIIATAVDAVPNTGTSAAASFTIDNTPPTVTISAPSVTVAKNGTDVTYTITYGSADTVTLAAGDVSLNTTGGATATVGVTGAGTVTRTVTLSSITGDGTIGISIAAGTASDTAGNTALGAGPSTTFTADNTPPTITGISAPSVTVAKNGTDVTYTVTYSGADTVTLAAGDVSLNTTGGATATVGVTGAGTVTRTVTLSNITGDGTIGISIAAGTASDTAGNTALGAGPSTTFTADNTPPTITGISAPSVTVAKNGTDVTYTVTYSGADTVTLAAGDVSLNTTGGATATVGVTGAGTVTRTVTLSNITGDGTIGISIAAGTASDTAGNTALGAGPSTTFTADNTPPTITGISAPSVTVAKNGTDVTYTVTYSGADTVTLAAGDVSLNTTGGATATVGVTGAGTVTRTVTLSTITGDGTIGISIAAGTASDTAGNTALGAGPSTTFTADNTAPTVTITSPAVGTWDGTQSLTFTPDDGTTDARISTGTWEAKASGVIINTLSGWGPPASGANYTVEVRSTDPAGNIGSASQTYTMP